MIGDFHLLRPWWLLALLVPIWLVWLSYRATDVRGRWKKLIAPHLLDSLVIDGAANSRIKPSHLLAVVMALAAIAASGPTWRHEAPPFVENTAPLVIAVDLSPTMDAIDVTPSRLERAKLKVKDVVAARQGARTAIVAYAGSAHLVLPLTDDAFLIGTYVDALATRIMPVEGKDTTKALAAAEATLAREGAAGTILFVTDGVERTAFEAFKASKDNEIIVLGIGTKDGGPVKGADGRFLTTTGGARLVATFDTQALRDLQSASGAEVATFTTDGTDVDWITEHVRTRLSQKDADKGERWKDMGWWLLIPVAALFALTFRRGWVVRLGMVVLAAGLLFGPGRSEAGDFTDMWLTQDQQGRMAFETGDYAGAAAHFANPMWRGVSLYRAGKFDEAVDAFASVDTAESWYNQGNALLYLSRPEDAVPAYKKALELRKAWPEAQANLAIAETLLKAKKDEQDEQGEPSEKPDQIKFDDKGKQGKKGVMKLAEQTSELWMKNIQVSPADLMARKFAIEAGAKTP